MVGGAAVVSHFEEELNMATYTGTASSKILLAFQTLSEDERHRIQLQLLEGTEVRELKVLYEKIKQLLSFDCLAGLPIELAEKVLWYLDVASICTVTQCCRKWRDLANRDTIWYALCQRKNYIKFENLPVTLFSEHASISPHHKLQELSQIHKLCSDTNICKWKQVYIKANALMRHWRVGIYKVAPLLKGHRLQVTTIGCTNDFLVSGSSDSTSRIWSLKTLECLHVLEGHTDAVNCVAIKDDVIVTGCSDSIVRVYDVHSGQCLKLLHGHSGSVDHIAFDGSIAISGGSDCSLRIWDVHNGKLIHTLIGHTEEIECVIFEEDNLALSGSWDCTLRVWDIVAGICKLILTGHTEVVYCCCAYVLSGEDLFLSRRQVYYSGGGDAVIKGWDIQTGDNVLTLQGHTQEVLSIKCNKELIASASSDSTIRIWKADSGTCSYVLRGHIGIVRCLNFKGNILISGGDRKRIIAWNTETGEELYTVHKQQSLLHRLCVTDTQIITASPDSPGSISVISFW